MAGRYAFLRQAEQAFRAALEVYTRDSSPADWARTQFNLAYFNLVSVFLQNDTPEEDTVVTCAYLREAAQYIENTLSVYTPEAHPVDHLQATKLQEMIEEALQASHCGSETEEQQ